MSNVENQSNECDWFIEWYCCHLWVHQMQLLDAVDDVAVVAVAVDGGLLILLLWLHSFVPNAFGNVWPNELFDENFCHIVNRQRVSLLIGIKIKHWIHTFSYTKKDTKKSERKRRIAIFCLPVWVLY